MKRFLWLSTGIFSAAAFAVAFAAYLLYGSYQAGGSNFIAASPQPACAGFPTP